MPDPEAIGALLHDLVATPSPSGDEGQAAQLLADRLSAWGLETWFDGAGNVHARAGGASAGRPRVLLLGHIDTVPGQPPVRCEEGVLWGRGSVDAKGPLVSHAAALAALADQDAVDVELVAAVGEETDSRGARHLVDEMEAPDAVVIAEPTGVATVGLGYKGYMRGALVARAREAHPGHPAPTASERLLAGLEALTVWSGNPSRDPAFEETTVRIGQLTTEREAGEQVARAGVDIRLPGGVPDVASLDAMMPEGVSLEVEDALPAVRGDPRGPLATAVRGTLAARGTRARMAIKTGSSDWNVVEEAWGVPAVAYGPGDPSLDHTWEERIVLEEVLGAAQVLEQALQAWADRVPARSSEEGHSTYSVSS
ncbi:MAG: M20/M25/M40 family metallo-hydrolase [Candidatus Thermoplasmatota archaeon]|nr:M20/M25/M40 family metallo-hydrolase [Candidatus Thermoplasmatota archaeon]